MRPWPLLALALLACEQGVPAGSPSNRRESERERQARIDQETEARRRREREAQLVEELEKEKEKNARLEMEERERDRAREERANAARPHGLAKPVGEGLCHEGHVIGRYHEGHSRFFIS